MKFLIIFVSFDIFYKIKFIKFHVYKSQPFHLRDITGSGDNN